MGMFDEPGLTIHDRFDYYIYLGVLLKRPAEQEKRAYPKRESVIICTLCEVTTSFRNIGKKHDEHAAVRHIEEQHPHAKLVICMVGLDFIETQQEEEKKKRKNKVRLSRQKRETTVRYYYYICKLCGIELFTLIPVEVKCMTCNEKYEFHSIWCGPTPPYKEITVSAIREKKNVSQFDPSNLDQS